MVAFRFYGHGRVYAEGSTWDIKAPDAIVNKHLDGSIAEGDLVCWYRDRTLTNHLPRPQDMYAQDALEDYDPPGDRGLETLQEVLCATPYGSSQQQPSKTDLEELAVGAAAANKFREDDDRGGDMRTRFPAEAAEMPVTFDYVSDREKYLYFLTNIDEHYPDEKDSSRLPWPHVYVVTEEVLAQFIERGWVPQRKDDELRLQEPPDLDLAETPAQGWDVEPVQTDNEKNRQVRTTPPIRQSIEARVELLGTSQDGGIPHVTCECPQCTAARTDDTQRRLTNSLLVTPVSTETRILFEATPDIRFQIKWLPDYLFLSHDLSGHTTGLYTFAEEAIDSSSQPVVHCSEELSNMVSEGLTKRLVKNRNIALDVVETESEVQKIKSFNYDSINIEVFSIPYEFGETTPLGYIIGGSEDEMLYLPRFGTINEDLIKLMNRVDIAIIEGFVWRGEREIRSATLPEEDLPEIMKKLDQTVSDTTFYFTNLNHTHKALSDPSKRERMKNDYTGDYNLAEDGMNIFL